MGSWLAPLQVWVFKWRSFDGAGYQGTISCDASKPDGTPQKQLDVSRLAALGWRARILLGEGLASPVAFFRQELAQQLVRL